MVNSVSCALTSDNMLLVKFQLTAVAVGVTTSLSNVRGTWPRMPYLNCGAGNGIVGSKGKRRIPQRRVKSNWKDASKVERQARPI